MYYAHSTDTQDKKTWQLLEAHLKKVANRASEFAKAFNADQLGYAAGLLHDIGKYSPEFQKRLDGSNIKVDHSTAGAHEASKLYDEFKSIVLAYIITGHHGGLLDFGSQESGLQKRLSKQSLPDYSAYKNEIVAPNLDEFHPHFTPINNQIGFMLSFYIRMLFSCLVDADFLDTEGFISPDKSSLRGQYESFDILSKKFDNHMDGVFSKAENSSINRHRKDIYEQCRGKANLSQQMFSLTVPTGGGKTLSSMAFALDHLNKHNLNRIFYVIPYTSIIEQNAEVFRKIFGNKNVLEHHSNYDPKNETNEDTDAIQEKLKLSSENWDMPIVVTTNVQIFESMFSNKVSRCRKLHNLSNSVIILDEAQLLPTGFLKPCLAALSELVVNYGSTVVICTATQPNLNKLLDERVKPVEIMRSPQELYKLFKRVHVTDIGEISDADLSAKLKTHKQVLCIVNTRKHAQKLYEQLSELKRYYHLSARMCPVHRRKVLNDIKALLDTGTECHVVSTRLIDAGVDIDFPFVYEAMAGIDSVCQGAGRCNREGKLDSGEVYVFRSAEGYRMTHWQSRVAEIGSMIFNAYKDDPLSLPAVDKYFKELYFFEDDALDKKRIMLAFENGMPPYVNEIEFPFEDVAYAFKFIEQNTRDIIIPYDDNARHIIEQIKHTKFPVKYIRSLQGYTVSIYRDEFEKLEKMNAIFSINDRFFILKDYSDYYSECIGLISPSTSRTAAMEFLHL
jgi:CRISPR-associated endonuclease/helicase Cas3